MGTRSARRRFVLPALILAAAVVLALTSCGGGKDDATPGTTTPPSGTVAPTSTPLPFESSPFGFHPASIVRELPAFTSAADIGVHWHRPPLYAFWALVQPVTARPDYDWAELDRQYTAVPEGINILANIDVQPRRGGIFRHREPRSFLPRNEEAYTAFVRAAVERYDGDGLDDAPELAVPIRYWQVSNEPNTTNLSDFAAFQRLTYTAIKEACPQCQVLIGGATVAPSEDFVEAFDQGYAKILKELDGQYVDILDIHWYGDASGDYRILGGVLNQLQPKLEGYGFGDTPIWVTEMGTYSGNPQSPHWVFQSEEEQAADLVKRHVYSLSQGVEKVFLAFGLMEGFKHEDGYFDHTGLIYDGEGSDDRGRWVRKIGYYTYKVMTEKLEGATFDYELEGLPEDVYGYFFRRNDASAILVLWYDNFHDPAAAQQVTLGVDSPVVALTEALTDQGGAITTAELTSVDGSVTLTLGQSPVFLESGTPPGDTP